MFRIAGDNFTAVSIALPVFGIAGVSGEPFPLIAACDVMYQALIAATKQGIPLKQVSFVCSDPKQVNAIVTSIKVKIQNVHYDTRLVYIVIASKNVVKIFLILVGFFFSFIALHNGINLLMYNLKFDVFNFEITL